ncbi:TrmH family RNA methyltransferase [Almyronema epifaneia]|uniref:TrmH family RNA methyltransferase n=1 Tax=Almyronema epifaneia S1 TaxID=2991925 RepID=A0ABW6IGK4_9CYAN
MRSRYEQLPRHSLIICASLVQNAMNLGALCRTVEVFRLQALVLPTLAVVQDRQFRKLAASAHQWQPLQACSADCLVSQIQAWQQQGYGVYALTPAATAKKLPLFEFPQKAVLVLGRELTGVPPEIMQACQGAIAIPQLGLVESLNVSTAAAIAIYAYTQQHGLPEPEG